MKVELNLPCSESRLSRIVHEKLGFRQKKKVSHGFQTGRVPDVQEKRKEWQEKMEQLCREKPVFLDESAANTNLVRRYGRVKRGGGVKRFVQKASREFEQTGWLSCQSKAGAWMRRQMASFISS